MNLTTLPDAVVAGDTPISHGQVPSMGMWDRLKTGMRIASLRLREALTKDTGPLRALAGSLGLVVVWGYQLLGRSMKSLRLLCSLHRADLSNVVNRHAEQVIRQALDGHEEQVAALLEQHYRHPVRTASTANFLDMPHLLLGIPTIVLKSPQGTEKGLLLAHYNHIFPLLAGRYDLKRIATRFHIILEPSWRGYCEPDLLCYGRLGFPVFIQTIEPRDAAFLNSIGGPFIQVPTGGNWWVDHRVFHPRPEVEKRFDVVMLAAWGKYKRHHRFFHALGRLRRSGHRLDVLLVGGNATWKRDEILRQARYYGIADQIELQEHLPYERVNDFVNQAKVHVLWSRNEGFPRATIECMFAGLPSIIREGFNYGHRYNYINDQTGAFATESSLPRVLLEMIERAPSMSPRAWAMQHMSCQHATRVMSDTIKAWCADHDEPWTESPVVKVTRLNELRYWDERDKARFAADYEFLRSAATK